MTRKLAAMAALALAGTALASCGESEAPVVANPDMPEGISVANARLALPAVKGNPAAVYFDISNAGPKSWTIRSAHVDGAESTALHQMGTWELKPSMDLVEQVPVPQGQTVKFEPSGLHVMAFKLHDTLAAGGKTEVTVTFAGGDKASFKADILAAGDAR